MGPAAVLLEPKVQLVGIDSSVAKVPGPHQKLDIIISLWMGEWSVEIQALSKIH